LGFLTKPKTPIKTNLATIINLHHKLQVNCCWVYQGSRNQFTLQSASYLMLNKIDQKYGAKKACRKYFLYTNEIFFISLR